MIERIVSAGFLVLKPMPRPERLSKYLLPEQIVNASMCICPQFPASYAISWCTDSTERRVSEFERIGLPTDAREDATRWATAEFGKSFGWPGVFYTLDAALDARSRFFPNGVMSRLTSSSANMDHSWLCNHLEHYAPENLGIRPGPTGLIESLEEAARCCEAISRQDVESYPGPWFPWLLGIERV